MRLIRHSVFGFIASCSFAVCAFGLDWKTQTLAVTTAPFQNELAVVFEFKNNGLNPVAIRELETSCSCLRADSDLKLYTPGASGRITAKFSVGDRGGLYERGITVITDEADSPVHLLLKVEVPEVAWVTPRSVAWLVNDEPVEKTVEIESLSGLNVDFATAQSTSDSFSVRLEPVESGRKYRLHLKPVSTIHPSSAAVRIYGREKSGHDILISAYASIH